MSAFDPRLLVASGKRVLAGRTGLVYSGSGRVFITTAPKKGMDMHLLSVLTSAVDALRLVVDVNSVDTGKHVKTSRHYDGRAVDMNRIGSLPGIMAQATLENPHAMQLARYLLANGFHVGEGAPPRPGLIFGPVHTTLNPTSISHSTHLHISLPRAPGLEGALGPAEEAESTQ